MLQRLKAGIDRGSSRVRHAPRKDHSADVRLLEDFTEPISQSLLGKEGIGDNERSTQPKGLQQLSGFFECAASDAENSRQSNFRNHLTQRSKPPPKWRAPKQRPDDTFPP